MALTLTSTLLTAVLFAQPDPGGDGLHVFPLSSGCTTTLQACIDNAEVGDIIDVATAAPIDEDLIINKSLVLRAAQGVSPVVGNGSTGRTLTVVVVSPTAAPEQSVTIEGLTLNNTRVLFSLSAARDHSLNLRRNVIRISDGDVTTNGVFIRAEVPAKIVVEDNRIESSGTGLRLQVRSDELVVAHIARNVLTTMTPATSTSGLFLDLAPASQSEVGVISNTVFGTGSVGSFAAGIKGSVQAVSDLSISHNTVYATQGMTDGIDLNISEDASGALNLFNNTVSASTGRGYLVTSRAANGALATAIEGNHSFDNAEEDFLFDSTANQSLGTVTLNGNPMFTDPTGDDFSLRAGSPLIDAAVDMPSQGSFSLDAARAARPVGPASDIGALEFGADPLQLFTSLQSFIVETRATRVSQPYPGPLDEPPPPFVSGEISFEAIAPSSLFFDNWVPDPTPKGGLGVGVINELALNGTENLIIRSTVGPVFGMGIEFNDQAGGSTPSIFTLNLLNAGSLVGSLRFDTPNSPFYDAIGVWSPVPFDELQFVELALANENEFFGQVYTTERSAARRVFADGFE